MPIYTKHLESLWSHKRDSLMNAVLLTAERRRVSKIPAMPVTGGTRRY